MTSMGSRDGNQRTGITSPNAEDNLANVDPGHTSVRLPPGSTHTGLESIGSSARQHLVDAHNVEGVSTNTEVESFLPGNLDEVSNGESLVRLVLRYPRSSCDPRLTCSHRCAPPPRPQSSAVHTRWRPGECKAETRQRLLAFYRDRRFGSWGREHHG